MKNLYVFLLLATVLVAGCKTKEVTADSDNNQQKSAEVSTTWGTVSHKYRPDGCSIVLLVSLGDGQGDLTLIPKDPVPAEFDKDGLFIRFDYRLLKMPNPEGCTTGIPAEITNIQTN